jgi:hypothetical protein
MHSLVRTVFSRLNALDPIAEEKKLQTIDEDVQDGEIKMTVSPSKITSEDDTLVAQAESPSEKEETITTPTLHSSTAGVGPRHQCTFLISHVSL